MTAVGRLNIALVSEIGSIFDATILAAHRISPTEIGRYFLP